MKEKLKTKDWLEEQYTINNYSAEVIGNMVGCTKYNVLYFLKKHNIPIRTATDSHIKNKDCIALLEDRNWLYEQYISNKKSTKKISDEIGCSKSFVSAYLIKHDIKSRTPSETKIGSKETYNRINNKNWLFKHYIENEKTIMEIASELQINESTVSRHLKKFDIEIRDNSRTFLGNSLDLLNNKDWLFEQYTTLSKSSTRISDDLCCHSTTVYNYLKKHDIEIRTEHYVSTLEHKIRNFLDDNGMTYISSDREQIKPLELDIYIPDTKIAIEINGVYWHSELYKSNDYHEKKRKLCESKGIRLINLYEDDLNERFDIIKRFLLNALGVNNEQRIFARKCVINHKPNKDMVKRFMDLYHIQGYAANNKAISLDYEGKMVAVMLFKGNVLTRYTTSKKVVGGFSKLLKASSIDEFITFVDLDTFTGDAYFKVGFEIDCYLKPDYKYVVGDKRIHKFNFRLKKFREDPNLLYEEGLTEKQLAQLNNIPRIYDSGKYRLKINLGK